MGANDAGELLIWNNDCRKQLLNKNGNGFSRRIGVVQEVMGHFDGDEM